MTERENLHNPPILCFGAPVNVSVETSPVKGEASHIQDLSPEKQRRYRNFTDNIIDIGSKSLIAVSSFAGVVNCVDSNKEFYKSNLITLGGFIGVGILGYLYARFRKKATSMVTGA